MRLWEGGYTYLESKQGLVTLAVKREVPIENLSSDEQIELEETTGKMEQVFQTVFSFGDFVRWMPLDSERVIAYLFPIGGFSKIDEVDMELKVRLMLATLGGKQDYLPRLNKNEIEKIYVIAKATLSNPQLPLILQNANLSTINAHSAFKLLKKELHVRGEPCHLKWKEGMPFKLNFTTNCRVFCNKEIIANQYESETQLHYTLFNPNRYVEYHLMIIPKRHITSLTFNSKEEILDKYRKISQFNRTAKDLGFSNTALLTRVGWRSGQTQPHLHDHLLSFSLNSVQPWMTNWAKELSHF